MGKINSHHIKDWFDSVVKGIKKKYEIEPGDVPPFAMGMSENGTISVFPMLWQTDSDKENFAKALKQYSIKEKYVAIVFISEMWITRRDQIPGVDCTYDNYGRPSEQTDKMEGILIICETNLGTEQYCFQIKRDKEKPYLSELNFGKPMSTHGVFSNFLQKPYGQN